VKNEIVVYSETAEVGMMIVVTSPTLSWNQLHSANRVQRTDVVISAIIPQLRSATLLMKCRSDYANHAGKPLRTAMGMKSPSDLPAQEPKRLGQNPKQPDCEC
jgi:hypothetical protein